MREEGHISSVDVVIASSIRAVPYITEKPTLDGWRIAGRAEALIGAGSSCLPKEASTKVY